MYVQCLLYSITSQIDFWHGTQRSARTLTRPCRALPGRRVHNQCSISLLAARIQITTYFICLTSCLFIYLFLNTILSTSSGVLRCKTTWMFYWAHTAQWSREPLKWRPLGHVTGSVLTSVSRRHTFQLIGETSSLRGLHAKNQSVSTN